ncbi:MAG: T9SS type A sorting domain-containing protein, partial [Bacteroidota bacterium]
PFNPTTEIRYQISEVSHVTLKVFDVLGREVATLVNEALKAGSYQTTFDASGLASGTYFYRINAGNYVETRKMILVR